MNPKLRREIEGFVEKTIVKFHQNRAEKLKELKLSVLLQAKNPYLFRAKNVESAADFVKSLLDARLSSSEEGSFGVFMEELAIFIAGKTSGGQKSTTTGIDIDLTREGTRYLIAVKSGKNWGNSTQHAELRRNFTTAVKVLKQSKQGKDPQPTLGICYGKFKIAYKENYLHIGGQSFWHLLSGDEDLYTDLIEPLGHRAEELNQIFEEEKVNTYNRMTRDFTANYCKESGAIDWQKVVEFNSRNMESQTGLSLKITSKPPKVSK
jgi:hypothetical protein